ncbi:hypothetical protein A9K55_005642 [Cordyceps militaris]|uniref:Uncharacterized protein n=1 Tax=Cordyceps militaris TaxID=73501 RepID=A0A2H4SDJ1_CORMI|nr:hypothetical protein A9K55_005642 [Cordyceps militaris]
MTNGNAVVEEAIADMIGILAEDRDIYSDFPASSDSRQEPQGGVRVAPLEINLLYPQDLADNVFAELPYTDPTYTAIDGRLIPSRSSLGVKLCQFRTFQGALALQPCISDERQLGFFDALHQWEAADDRNVYRTARFWSCRLQSIPDLPKPCRWLAATIFNFASEMLRPDNTQDYMWEMRAWLDHWYSIAQGLFFALDFDLSTPDPEWFTGAQGDDDSTGSDGTVVHHVLSPEAFEFTRGSILHPIARITRLPLADE